MSYFTEQSKASYGNNNWQDIADKKIEKIEKNNPATEPRSLFGDLWQKEHELFCYSLNTDDEAWRAIQKAQQFANKNFDKARKHAYKSGWSEEEVQSAVIAIRQRDGTKKSVINRRTLLLQLVSDLLRTSVAWLSFPKA